MLNLTIKDIQINQTFADKRSAIQATGKLLVENGYTDPAYTESMIARDQLTSTYIGNMVAIPHGTDGSQNLINHSGIVITQVPDGVEFDGNIVKVVIGIAGLGDEHLELLSTIAIICSEIENVENIVMAQTENEIIDIFRESGEHHE